MRDQLRALEEVQRLDTVLREMEENLVKYPDQISSYNNEIQSLRDKVSQATEELNDHNAQKEQIERQLNENDEMIKKSDKRLFEIKTHREYQALAKEIAKAKQQGSTLEEDTLKEMEQVEKLEAVIQETQEVIVSKESEYNDKINELTLELERIKGEYESMQQEKTQAASHINSEILEAYEKVKTRNGVAIVRTINQVCQGCFMNIPPQLYNEVVANSKLIQCPNCLRILFYENQGTSAASA
ncbi:MAG: hypothetical protein IH874_01365 [Candidatus Dadabacteria bacterium]|nr:hypothetical protein [Candidatus Dadabacteria bacterium]